MLTEPQEVQQTCRGDVPSLGRIWNKLFPILALRAQSFIKEESKTTQQLQAALG